MEKNNYDYREFVVLPSLKEVEDSAKTESLLLPKNPIDNEWIKASFVYKYLFGLFLIEQTGLDRLDKKISDNGILFCADEKKQFFQKYDSTGMKYFYIRCNARIERLNEKDIAILSDYIDNPSEQNFYSAMIMVSETYKTVMSLNPDLSNTFFEPVPTINGEYQIKGDTILLAVNSIAEFNEAGELVSEEKEMDRLKFFYRLSAQIDESLSKDLGCNTKTVIELFYV